VRGVLLSVFADAQKRSVSATVGMVKDPDTGWSFRYPRGT